MSLLICELESGTAFAWFWVNFWVSVRRGSFEVRFSKDTKKTVREFPYTLYSVR